MECCRQCVAGLALKDPVYSDIQFAADLPDQCQDRKRHATLTTELFSPVAESSAICCAPDHSLRDGGVQDSGGAAASSATHEPIRRRPPRPLRTTGNAHDPERNDRGPADRRDERPILVIGQRHENRHVRPRPQLPRRGAFLAGVFAGAFLAGVFAGAFLAGVSAICVSLASFRCRYHSRGDSGGVAIA
jgi:hypothetical protein